MIYDACYVRIEGDEGYTYWVYDFVNEWLWGADDDMEGAGEKWEEVSEDEVPKDLRPVLRAMRWSVEAGDAVGEDLPPLRTIVWG